jgi:Rieske Fe-S protein
MEGVTRRDVLATAGAAVAAGCVAGCMSQQREKDKPPLFTSGTVNVGPASDYPAGRAIGKFMDTYGIFIANDSGTPVAIRPKCTHLGCTVEWHEERHGFECPCHHSTFSLLGVPQSGPAKRPLPLIPCTRLDDGTLAVDLTKLYAL